MAPSRKRSRGDEVEDHDTETEYASSSFQQSAKRSRVALAQERGGSAVSDDESEEDLTQLANGFAELDEDEHGAGNLGAEEDEDEEIDELRASQFVQKGIRNQKENVASEYGVIEEVRCRNFMCHGNLRIKLGPLINFIIGHNGSGKSAVLTALTMCLGGKATATNRGASLKSLIKEDEESATLAVKIKNKGDGAYKADLYGSSITVERHFSRSGASGFKIKNAEDKIITTKKGDLDDILDYFAFQLDNPINVLTQDMARQFLSNSTAADKYKFFIKGTQLETLDADYKVLEEHLDGIEAKLHSRQEDIDMLRQKAEEAEKRKKTLDASRSIEDKIKKTQWMHAWAQVEEQEKILENYDRDVKIQQDRIEEATAEAEDASGAYDGHNQAFEAAANHLDTLKANVGDVEAHWLEEKAAFDANTNELLEQRAQERRIKDDLKAHKTNKKRLEQEIAQEEDRLHGAEGPQHAERQQRLQDLVQAVADVEQRINGHLSQRAELEAKRDKARAEHDESRKPIGVKKEELQKVQQLVARLQSQQGSKFSSFRPRMAQLVKAVDNETRWRKKPVGPMGLHVKLKKPEWSSQIEKTFGGVLEAFVCTNKNDQMLLSQIMKRIDCAVQIYIGPDQPLDTTGKEPDEGLDTMLRVLDIDNAMVRNQLIINQAIEQLVLIPNSQKASDFISKGQMPRNVRAAIAFGAARGTGLRYERTRSGEPKSSPVAAWEGPARMQTDRAEQIRRARENEDHAKRELNTVEQASRDLQNLAKLADQAFNRWERQNKELRLEKEKADDAVEAMQNEIENNKPQDGKLQELQNQLVSVNEDVNATQSSYQDGVDWKDRLNDQATELKAKSDAALKEYQTAATRIQKAENRKGQLEVDRSNALRQKNLALTQIDHIKAQAAQYEERRDTQQKRLQEDFIPPAEAICRRITVDEGATTAILDRRLEKFIKEFENAQREAGGTREELTMAWRQAKQEYKDAIGQLSEMSRFSKTIKRTLGDRAHRWKMFRKYISFRARFMFSYLLSERQFRGRVIMDHKGKELDIKVEPDLTKQSDSGRKTQTLSGGEKSFSTICLLLAIWEAMGSPIRCLDEFDVFMDSVNRATSMSMMIQAARRSVGRQFILITPQSMSNVQLGEDVSIHKMSDPERGQTTLPFTQG
ncbi:hypothetical protein Q7P37_008623 [Cladosporium fusiforme]